MKQAGVYILESIRNNRFYIGSTINIQKRVEDHNLGRVKATQHIQPLSLKIFIPCETLTAARIAEYRLKQYKRKDILERVIESKVFPWEYSKRA